MSEVPPIPRRKDSLPIPKVPPLPPVPNRKNYLPTRPRAWSVIQPKTTTTTITATTTAAAAITTTTSTATNTVATDSAQSSSPRSMSATSRVSSSPEPKLTADIPETTFEAPNHYHESFKALWEFYNKQQLCDLEIRVGKKSIRCHRVVLACVSNYFKGMFTSDMSESKQGLVTIHDIDEQSLQSLVTFAYTSKICLNVDNVQHLLYASSILQMETVAQACCDFMQNHLHPTNCVGVRNFAEQHGRTELVKFTDEYVLEHFLEVVDHEEFANMPYKVFNGIVSAPNLNVTSEVQVYEGVMKWVKQDLFKRRCYLPKLLANIKLPLMPLSYLMDCVETEELLKKSFECRDLLDEAKHYQMSLTNLVLEVKVTERMKPRKSYAGVLFCVGGRGAAGDPFQSIECYDYRKDKWFPVTEMNTRRRHVGVCAASGYLYAIGGHDGTKHLSSGEVFDPVTNTWSNISPMGTLRRGIALACLGGPIYAIGGLDDASCFNTVERYDPSTDTWTFLSSMKVPRGGVGVTALKGFLYAVGGNDGSTSLDSCERYDPLTNKWAPIASMKKRRAGAGVTVLNGMVYAVGGFDDNAPLHSMERYDPVTDVWTLMPSMSCCRGGVGVATLGGKIFAVGGHDGSSYLNSVEAFDPSFGKWEMMADVEVCRAGAGVAVLDCPVEQLEDMRKIINTSGPAGRL